MSEPLRQQIQGVWEPRHTRCSLVEGCEETAPFLVFAAGYPAAMGRVCATHLGPLLARDVAIAPGSTLEWRVEFDEPAS